MLQSIDSTKDCYQNSGWPGSFFLWPMRQRVFCAINAMQQLFVIIIYYIYIYMLSQSHIYISILLYIGFFIFLKTKINVLYTVFFSFKTSETLGWGVK